MRVRIEIDFENKNTIKKSYPLDNLLFLDSPESRSSIYTNEVRWLGGSFGRVIVGIVPAEGHLGQSHFSRPCFFNCCPLGGVRGALGEPWGAPGSLGETWGPVEIPVILLELSEYIFNVLILEAFQKPINIHSRDFRGPLGTREGLLNLFEIPAIAFRGLVFEPPSHPWGSLGSLVEMRKCLEIPVIISELEAPTCAFESYVFRHSGHPWGPGTPGTHTARPLEPARGRNFEVIRHITSELVKFTNDCAVLSRDASSNQFAHCVFLSLFKLIYTNFVIAIVVLDNQYVQKVR